MLTKRPTLQNQWYENISNHMFFGYKYCGQFIFNLYILLIETSFPANVNRFSTWKLLLFIRFANTMSITINVDHIFNIYPQWMACSSSCKRIQSWPDFVNVKEKWWGERGEPKKSFLDAKSHSCHPRKKEEKCELKRQKLATSNAVSFLPNASPPCGWIGGCVPSSTSYGDKVLTH